ncbi:unnamed protein product [Tilletia caries]|nr:unnamed protein product [Tilletia caries]
MASGSRSVALGGLRIARASLFARGRVDPLKFRIASRAASTASSTPEPGQGAAEETSAPAAVNPRSTYRFSSAALIRELPAAGANGVTPLARGSQPNTIFKGVLPRVHQALRAQLDPSQARTALVDRRSAEQLPPGSVLTVETWTSTAQRGSTSFSGVLIAIRRRGMATSLVLRTLVANKLGVEMRFSLYSPLIKQIKVVARAEASKRQQGLRRTRRAKLYYLRRDDRRLNAVAGMVKAQRQAEEAAQERAAKAALGPQQQKGQQQKGQQQKRAKR